MGRRTRTVRLVRVLSRPSQVGRWDIKTGGTEAWRHEREMGLPLHLVEEFGVEFHVGRYSLCMLEMLVASWAHLCTSLTNTITG